MANIYMSIRKDNQWLRTIKKVQAANPGAPMSEVFKKAKMKYRKSKQRGGAIPSPPIGIAPIMRPPRKLKYEIF